MGDGIPGCGYLLRKGQMRWDRLLQAVLVGLDHLLDHLAAHRAGLLAGQVAVVALLQVDAYLIGGLHLELVHGLAGAGHDQLVAAIAVTGHFVVSPFCFVFFCLLWMIVLDGTSAAILRPGGAFYTRGGFPVSVIFPCASTGWFKGIAAIRGCNLGGSEYNRDWTTE